MLFGQRPTGLWADDLCFHTYRKFFLLLLLLLLLPVEYRGTFVLLFPHFSRFFLLSLLLFFSFSLLYCVCSIGYYIDLITERRSRLEILLVTLLSRFQGTLEVYRALERSGTQVKPYIGMISKPSATN